MFLVTLTSSCTTNSNNTTNENQLNFPSRYVGNYIAVQSGRHATITANSITIQTADGNVFRNKGNTTLDTQVMFKSTLNQNEELILLSGNGYLGITMYSNGNTINSEYYLKQ